MSDEMRPKDHAEAVALFRAQVIGPLVCRDDWTHGELAAARRELATQRFVPPGSDTSRSYAASTLERWMYQWRRGGLEALRPGGRSDRGHGRALTPAQRKLLLDIRREHPGVATTVIRRTLEQDGRLQVGAVSDATLRRLFAEHGLPRRRGATGRANRAERRRWQAPQPHAVWHADVMHGPAIAVGKRSVPLRIHAILDDRTRFVVAIQACATERESEMLALLVKAIRAHGTPECLYLDNGPTYVGDTLRLACARLGITLVHAKPHDPQARGKMERLWRTLREQCVDFMGAMGSHHDVQVRLLAWLERHYLDAPHSSLMGSSPRQTLAQLATRDRPIDERLLREALTLRQTRRLRGDGTIDIAGTIFELSEGFLAGRKVTVARTLLDPTEAPWVEYEGQVLALKPVDAEANATRKRSRRAKRGLDAVPFDPPAALLRALLEPKRGGR